MTAIDPSAPAQKDQQDQQDDVAFEPLLLLASASAGRRATLAAARIAHAVLPVDLDEEALLTSAREAAGEETPTTEEEVLLLARAKAEAGTARSEGGYVVLGGDSMLELDGESVGKPHTPEVAAARWRAMRGRTAVLHSGHWLVDDRDPDDGGTGATLGAVASCEVSFADVSDEEIEAYVATGEPLGVAGAFTLDGIAGPFITGVHGDPHAVVGLSLPLLRRLLAELDLSVIDLWEPDVPGTEEGTPGI
ncbi:Maf family protein [Brachybacterium squillarum]|uniref:Maf family protein n=1 Tax=Brachybacterium squillarum TaxID=661979 RepID=UPI0002629D1B